jgi:hypothetical protein
MNKRLLITILSIAIATLLMIPSVALQYVTVDEFKTIVQAHQQTCDEPDGCSHLTGPYKLVESHNHARSGGVYYAGGFSLADQLALITPPVCTHEVTISYRDTDTGETGRFCTDCVEKWVDDPEALSLQSNWTPDIITSAAIRSVCDHSDYEYLMASATYHMIRCMNCVYEALEAHDILPADCENDEICSICNMRYHTWELRWGHEMDVVSDIFSYPYTHTYRCVRRDNDLQFICDYVAYTEECEMNTYWSPAESGTHFVYDVCVYCDGPGDWSEMPCIAEVGLCTKCNHPNEWEP